MKNLITQAAWYNPFTAVTKDLKCYELDNIIIYCENGILIETNQGWFDRGNNDLKEGLEIEPEIIYKRKVDFTKKENFVIKSEKKSYRFDCKYTLYLYYKNVNYKYNGLTLDSLFLNINYSILNEYNFIDVIGDRHKKSRDIENKITDIIKQLDHYNFYYHNDIFNKALKDLKKISNNFIKVKNIEDNYNEKNINECIRKENIKQLENNIKLEG